MVCIVPDTDLFYPGLRPMHPVSAETQQAMNVCRINESLADDLE